MPKPLPAALGNAYPVRRNFLKLTAFTLEVPQVASNPSPFPSGSPAFPPMAKTPNNWLQRADQAFYWAKSHGHDLTATADQSATKA